MYRDKLVIKELAVHFLEKYFPDCIAAMITGSYTEEYFNETSDVDILLVSKLVETIFIESYNFESVEFQAIVWPQANILEMLNAEAHRGEGTYLSMFKKGIIIRDSRNYLSRIQKFASTLYEIGPSVASAFEITQLRAMVTSRIEDMKGSNSYADNLFVLIDVFQKFLTLYSKYNRIWLQSSKYASRLLEKIDPKFKNEFVDSLSNFILNKDSQYAVNFLEKNLENLGGELHFFSTKNVVQDIKDDYLVIFLKNTEVEKLLPEIVLPFHEYVLSRIHPIEFFIYKSSGQKEKNIGVYILMKRDNTFLNEYIYPLTKSFFANIFFKSEIRCSVEFPLSVNPLSLSFSPNTQDLIYPVLTAVTNFFATKYKTTKLSDISVFSDGLWMMSKMQEVLHFTDKKFKVFLNYIFDHYLPYSYNLENDTPYNLLAEKRKQVLKEFENESDSFFKEVDSNNVFGQMEGDANMLNVLEKFSELYKLLDEKYEKGAIQMPEFELSLLPSNLTQKEKYLWVMYRKVLNYVLNGLFIRNRYKSYIIYLLIKKNQHELSA